MIRIDLDDPTREDVRALLAAHLKNSFEHSPAEDVHALDADGLRAPEVSFFSARDGARLLAIGALKEVDSETGEIKSMHTAVEARGSGIGSAMLAHLLWVGRERGYRSLVLETGSMDAFAPARALYRRAGFVDCGPFGEYVASPNSVFMRLALPANE